MNSSSAATFTGNTATSETNTTCDGQDIVLDGAGVVVAIDGPHAFNSLVLTNGAVRTQSPCTASAPRVSLPLQSLDRCHSGPNA